MFLICGWTERIPFTLTNNKLFKYGFDGNSEMMKTCQQKLIQMSSWMFRKKDILEILNIWHKVSE